MPTPLRERKAWQALERHYAEISGSHLRDLFAADPGRGERLAAEAAGIYLDYSKNRVTDETMALLIDLAEESGVPARRDAMFRGEHINVSEDRAVLHTALRLPSSASLVVALVEHSASPTRSARPVPPRRSRPGDAGARCSWRSSTGSAGRRPPRRRYGAWRVRPDRRS